jgi:NAD(P)-dependent dehydrogenase (short-subunit alcohol dehydrogenase family)
MARIFITGSADGLGQMAAKWLVNEGHQIVLHARNKKRGEEALQQVPGAENVLIADLSDMEETIQLAEKANATGRFDAIIHNAGVYQVAYDLIFAVNTLAPYILTCLIQKPKRLVYLSSGMHSGGNTGLENIKTGRVSYSDSKLHNVILSMAVARKWPEVYANAVDPGWVPTKMGGPAAPDNLQKGFETQAWLAASNDNEAKVSGRYFYHKKQKQPLTGADDISVQEKFLKLCEQITGIHFPADEHKRK